jgi:hypothetical protein
MTLIPGTDSKDLNLGPIWMEFTGTVAFLLNHLFLIQCANDANSGDRFKGFEFRACLDEVYRYFSIPSEPSVFDPMCKMVLILRTDSKDLNLGHVWMVITGHDFLLEKAKSQDIKRSD